MRRLFLLIVATVLLAGCIQTEGRYEVITSSGSDWLLDRSNGCVWLFAAERGFVQIGVMGLHEGKFLEEAEGCTKGG